MTLKKLAGKIHLWLGMTSGLVVFILGITGATFCFETELRYLIYANRYIADSPKGKPLPLRVLKAKAQEALGVGHPVMFALYKPGTNETYRFRSSKFNSEGITYFTRIVYYRTVYVNPFTGHIQYIENSKWEFFQTVLQIHNELLLGEAGHQITAWATVIFVVMLITGMVLWWPKSKAAAKQRFSVKWKAKWRRVNYDIHNVGGFYIFLLALVISIAGIFLAFETVRKQVKLAVTSSKPKKELPTMSDTTGSVNPKALDLIERNIAQQPAHSGLYMVSLPEAKLAPVVFTIMHNPNNYLQRSQFFFDKYTGKQLKAKPVEQWTGAENFLNMFYDIHIGKVLGTTGQILAFIASLFCATLPLTGFYIWWGRKKKKA